MPVRALHNIEYVRHKLRGDILVEEIRHGVDEDPPGCFPPKGKFQSPRPKSEIEALFEVMSGNASETLCERERVAMIATRRQASAARYRIPGSVGPFDGAVVCHTLIVENMFGGVNPSVFDASPLLVHSVSADSRWQVNCRKSRFTKHE